MELLIVMKKTKRREENICTSGKKAEKGKREAGSEKRIKSEEGKAQSSIGASGRGAGRGARGGRAATANFFA